MIRGLLDKRPEQNQNHPLERSARVSVYSATRLSAPCHRVLVVVRRNVDIGVELVRLGRRLIRRKARDWSRRRIAAFVPPLVVIGVISEVGVELLNFPYAAFFHILIFI